MVGVVGPAGIGKSRFCRELVKIAQSFGDGDVFHLLRVAYQ